MVGNWPKAFTSSKINTKQYSSRPRMFGLFQHHPKENQRKENLLSDSGAPVHMLSRKDLHSADMETVRVSRNLQMVVTASEEVANERGREQYTSIDLDLFVTVQLVEDAHPVCSLGQLCEDPRCSFHFDRWSKKQKKHLCRKRQGDTMQPGKLRAFSLFPVFQLRLPAPGRKVRPQHLNGRTSEWDNFTPEPVRTRSRRERHKDPGGPGPIPKPKQNNEGTGRHDA